jgi:hypothetical protein
MRKDAAGRRFGDNLLEGHAAGGRRTG